MSWVNHISIIALDCVIGHMAFPNPSSPPVLKGHVPASLAGGQHVLRCPLWVVPSHLQLLRRPGWHEMWVVWRYGKCSFLVFTVHSNFTCLSIQRFPFACCRLHSSHKTASLFSHKNEGEWALRLSCLKESINYLTGAMWDAAPVSTHKVVLGQSWMQEKSFYSSVILAMAIFSVAWPGFLILIVARLPLVSKPNMFPL